MARALTPEPTAHRCAVRSKIVRSEPDELHPGRVSLANSSIFEPGHKRSASRKNSRGFLECWRVGAHRTVVSFVNVTTGVPRTARIQCSLCPRSHVPAPAVVLIHVMMVRSRKPQAYRYRNTTRK